MVIGRHTPTLVQNFGKKTFHQENDVYEVECLIQNILLSIS